MNIIYTTAPSTTPTEDLLLASLFKCLIILSGFISESLSRTKELLAHALFYPGGAIIDTPGFQSTQD